MRTMLAAALLLSGLGCRTLWEPNYRNFGARPHEWDLQGPDYDVKVFGPMVSEDTEEFVREQEGSGWELLRYEPASLPEDVMVNTLELDQPARPKTAWRFDIPKSPDAKMDLPKKESIPPYLQDDVRSHRQKYLVIMRRWH